MEAAIAAYPNPSTAFIGHTFLHLLFGKLGFALCWGESPLYGTLLKKVNLILPVFKQRPAKGSERGWQKYLLDSPMEQTERNGEAVSANKGSTAHYH